MPKMSFNSDNKSSGQDNFPKLKLDQDESARIAIFEEPEVEFVHNLRTPKIVNGEVQYKVAQDGSRQMDFAFVSNPICLGDFNTLEERGIDPKNCPLCKAVQDAPDMFQAPKRRFAMHVFQYTTNGTSKATKAFQGSVKILAFTDQRFNEIADLREEIESGNLSDIDVILGPCENKLFQKYKIIASPMVKWKETEATRAQFQEIIQDNRAKDIRNFIGRPMKKDWMADEIVKVKKGWQQANGQQGETANDGLASAEKDLDAGLGNLLNTNESKKTEAPVNSNKNEEPVDFDKLLELEGL